MEPNIWGKHAWIFLHSVTMNYPEKPTMSDRNNYKTFFEKVQYILPCEVCKKHYALHIRNAPIDNALKSRRDLVEWLIEIHNDVNRDLNKQTLCYDEVIDYYKKLYNGELDDFNFKLVEIPKKECKTKNIKKNIYPKSKALTIVIIPILIFILWKIYKHLV